MITAVHRTPVRIAGLALATLLIAIACTALRTTPATASIDSSPPKCGAGYKVNLSYTRTYGNVIMRYNPTNRTVCLALDKTVNRDKNTWIGVRLVQGSNKAQLVRNVKLKIGPVYLKLPNKKNCRWSYSTRYGTAWSVGGSTGCQFYTG